MDPGEMKLSKEGAEFFLLRKEWVIDPPYLRRLPEEIFLKVARIHMQFMAKRADLEAQTKQLESGMFREIAEVM